MNTVTPTDLDVVKFHWDKWKEEAKSFWRRTIWSCALLILLILLQLDAISLQVPWLTYSPGLPQRIWINRLLFCPLSWFLLVFVNFGFVDLMRHRVPDSIEEFVHNNTIPLGPFATVIPLRTAGRLLYLVVFGSLMVFLLLWLGFITWYVWSC